MTAAAPSPPAALSALSALSASIDHLAATLAPSVLAVPGRHGARLASATVWRPGILVTVAHVFRRAPAALSVAVDGERRTDVALAGIDPGTDLAVFRLPDESLPALAVDAKAEVPRAGQLALAVGRAPDGDLLASFGLVHRVGGPWQSWLGGAIDRLLRLDGGLHDGMSGGPVAGADGRVLGIGTSALSRSQAVVIPVATVERVVDALLAKGQVARPFLGLSAQPVRVPGATDRSGLLVSALVDDGPAAQAGVMVGDILLEVDGHAATSLGDLRPQLAARVGDAVPARVLRGGQPVELSVTVGQWPTRAGCC